MQCVYRYRGTNADYIDRMLQLCWADTYMVGCGYTYYDDPKRGYSKLYVCNYGPGGNLVGGSMYKMGFPGMMSCHDFDLMQSSRYVGLCGENHSINLNKPNSKLPSMVKELFVFLLQRCLLPGTRPTCAKMYSLLH